MSQLNRWTIPQLWDFATGFGGFVFFWGGGGAGAEIKLQNNFV